MELQFSCCTLLNSTVSAKPAEQSYTVRTACSFVGLLPLQTTVVARDGVQVARIEWPAFGSNILTLGEDRQAAPAPIRVGAYLRRCNWYSHSRTFDVDGIVYKWLDHPFKPLRLVVDGEKLPIAVLNAGPFQKTKLSISTEGLLSLETDTILVTGLIMLHKRRQRRRRRHNASGGGP